MKEFCFDFKIYNYNKYLILLKKYKCYNNYYDNKSTIVGNKFMNDLLKISNNRCFMCGYTLETNNEKGIYAEREHLINKIIDGEKNWALNKCRKNIVPICRTCNGKKINVNISDRLKEGLQMLGNDCNGSKDDLNCSFYTILDRFKVENFDYNLSAKGYKSKSNEVYFDFISKTFFGNQDYINQFDLNYRTNIIFNDIFKALYNFSFNKCSDAISYIRMFSKSNLDDSLIEWLDTNNLISNNQVRDGLIETIILLENL